MWQGLDDLEIVHALVSDAPAVSAREIDPTVPEAIDRICARALQRAPDDRYATAADFRAEIEQYLAESGKLVDARRKLGAATIELFKDKRAEIRGVIETQLAALELVQQSGDYRAVKIPTESHSSPTPYSHALEEQRRTQPPGEGQTAQSFSAKPEPSRIGLAIGVLGTIAALGGAVAWVATQRSPAAPKASTNAADAPARAELDLRVGGSPPTAYLAIDDQPALPLPVAAKVARDGQTHRLRFTATGFVSKDEVVRFDRDVTLTVDLTPAPTAQGASSASASVAKVTAPAAPPLTWVPVTKKTADPPAETATGAAAATVAAPATATPTAAAPPTEPHAGGSGRKGAELLDKGDPWGAK
jgi:serine/threonine-protein kinase